MAVRARQQYYAQPIETPQVPKQPVRQKRTKTSTRFEKMLYIVLAVAVAVFAIVILNKQASIQTLTIEIEKIEAQANEISKQNVDLAVSVKDLSRYDRIWEKAQALGLTQNAKNVKVVPGE